jgi:hypothetical protein
MKSKPAAQTAFAGEDHRKPYFFYAILFSKVGNSISCAGGEINFEKGQSKKEQMYEYRGDSAFPETGRDFRSFGRKAFKG